MNEFIDKILAPTILFVIIVAFVLSTLGLSLLITGWIWVVVQSVWSMIF